MEKNKFIYFPSVTSGAFGGLLGKSPNGISPELKVDLKYFNESYGDLKYPYILISAGHNVNSSDIRNSMHIGPDPLVITDSGGYQIATGVLKYDPGLVDKILKWTEKNADIGVNLDIPTRGKYEGKFDECLDISKSNFKYWSDNRSNSDVALLNVLQGPSYNKYKKWYDQVSSFNFDGWSLGGATTTEAMIAGLTVLFGHGKIHLDNANKYLHILGTSKIYDLALLMYVQRKVQETGSNLILTCDSSSPSKGAVFGTMYLDFDIKGVRFINSKMPSVKNERSIVEKMAKMGLSFPDTGRYSKKIIPNFTYQDHLDSYDDNKPVRVGEISSLLILHNLGVFIDAVEKLREIMDADKYIYNDVLPPDLVGLFSIIDDIFDGKSYDQIVNRYYYQFKQLRKRNQEIKENEYF